MNNISTNGVSKIFNIKEKIACITLDFEMDYGDRIGEFNILDENEKDIFNLAELFSDLNIPVSTFITTDILINYPKSIKIIKMLVFKKNTHNLIQGKLILKRG